MTEPDVYELDADRYRWGYQGDEQQSDRSEVMGVDWRFVDDVYGPARGPHVVDHPGYDPCNWDTQNQAETKTIYLAGPINGCTDDEMHSWRDDMTTRLTGHTILTPVVRDYRGKEDESVEDIVEGDKQDVDASDVVIAFCPKPSVGTSMEVLYAWERGKHVIVYAPSDAPVSPWLRYHSHAVVHTATDVAARVSGL